MTRRIRPVRAAVRLAGATEPPATHQLIDLFDQAGVEVTDPRRLTNPGAAKYKGGVVTTRTRAACCCMEALWAPELMVVTR